MSSAGRRLLASLIAVAALAWLPAAAARVISARQLAASNTSHDATTAVPRRVLVRLRAPFSPEGQLGRRARDGQRAGIARTRDDVLRLSGATGPSVKRFRTVPYVALAASPATLDRLRRLPQVLEIREDAWHPPLLLQSGPLVGSTTVRASGFSGGGWSVAVLDTGVDASHSFLRGKVIAEACFSTAGADSASLCPGGADRSDAPGSGSPCAFPSCDHGTHVAGIAAGRGPAFSGIAADASIVAIQVFSRIDECGGGPCIGAYDSDLMRALEHVAEMEGPRIAAVNLSLGDGYFPAPCDDDPLKAAIDNLRSNGIATIVAAGNEGYRDGLSWPACISTSVSVGSTGDGGGEAGADAVSWFSNRAPFLSLLAPGEWITSSVPGGAFATWRGTSMSAPHVAGAWAVFRSAVPSVTVDDVLSALTGTGRAVYDPESGLTKPRIRLDAALPTVGRPAPADFDGDGKTDPGLFKGWAGIWDVLVSGSEPPSRAVYRWGLAGDVALPGDYDGDGAADPTLFRPSSGVWYILGSSGEFATGAGYRWGRSGDVPAPGDYDGDGRSDPAVFRPSTGVWYALQSSAGFALGDAHRWGINGDVPVPGDYDGDGTFDLAVFRPSTNVWYVLKSAGNLAESVAYQWGRAGDVPVAGDYDGDGRADLALYRPATGIWYILESAAGFTTSSSHRWGIAGDAPVPGDYDGDGRADPAVWRRTNGTWYVLTSSSGYTTSRQLR